ncbi:exportin-5-like [Rhinichthys klamathensis goyatoka]|uniref:exportin-5-like n=1 Tax=Rhinichthys klamathensis goyatoka TaxID=3034132 RepID=UPI0024B4FDFF|nr:exportin-5-like [Rhinichthys klamathensis goyatoka]
MAEPIRALCDELIQAVNVTMEAESSQTYRLEALKFIEDFKEKSPFCVECGLQLAEKSQTAVVRHFGLQILEHVVKFQWNNMAPQEKLRLKNCTMGLLSDGTHPILQEECHVKDALSRIVVEMIKQEWPQHWPDMLKEMEALAAMGDAQTELVMLVLLRLAEDVIKFQTLPPQRRLDIQHNLTENMDSIFTFLRGILIMQLHMNEYRKSKCAAGQELKTKVHWRVGVATLNTLAGYINWVDLSHITNENCRLLEILCLLLSEPELQLEAAECLLIAIRRRGDLEDRKPFLVLFDEVIMNYILSAAQSSGAVVERRYTFLKRLCQVLCALGSQICSLVVRVPVNLNKYMEALLAFTTHPSQFLRSSTQKTWVNLFSHEVISWDPAICQMTIKYLRSARINLVKTGFPSKNDCPGCEFSRVDFDSDEDFNCCFNSFRAHQGEAVRLACKIVPFEAFQIAREWAQYQINTPIDTGNTTRESCSASSSRGVLCSALSPSAVQWDAMTFFTESVFGQLFKILEKEKLPIDEGMELLQMVVNYETRDPLILSCVLTIISTLFPFVKHQPQFLPQVLDKVFTAITFELVNERWFKAPRTRAVKNVRRHACSSIIRMCRDYSDLILPCFDMMYEHVKRLFSNEMLLTQMEKCALIEALIPISNQFKDYNKQKAFLEELMAPVTAQWLSEEMRSVLWDPATFLAYVGADQVVSDPDTEDQMGINRSRISLCVYTILGVVKRARWPADPEEAKAGGFVISTTSDGTPIYRNPCAEPVQALLPNLLALIRTQNSLFLPENVNRLSKTFTRVYNDMDIEKISELGIPQHVLNSYGTPLYRNNVELGFFSSLYRNCYQLLGNAAPCLQQDFYAIEGLAEQIVGSAFIHLDSLPDHRLRPLVHVFMKQLVMSCPREYYDSLLRPLLGPLFAFLLQRLSFRWQIINQRTVNQRTSLSAQEEVYEKNHVTQEMAEEQLLRLVTREVIDLIETCVKRKCPKLSANKEDADGELMITFSMYLGMVSMNSSKEIHELSELGKHLLQSEDIYMNLLIVCFKSLSWKLNCQQTAGLLCWTLLKQVLGGNLLPEAVTWLFASVLKGLQMHGQHEGCNAALTHLALLIYEALRPRYAELRLIMNQIPDIQVDALEQFDQKAMIQPAVSKAGEKKNKVQFKLLIAGIVRKPLGQQFKEEVHIRDIPSLFKKPKPTKDMLENTDAAGLIALFSPDRDHC